MQMVDDTWYQRPEGIRERWCAGGLIARRASDGIRLAFASEWDFDGYVLPKGGIDDGETELDAAKREITEETGLFQLELLGDLGVRERLSFNRRRWVRCRYFLFRTDQVDGTPTDVKRHYVGPAWFPIDKLPTLFWPEQQELIEINRQRILQAMEEKGAVG